MTLVKNNRYMEEKVDFRKKYLASFLSVMDCITQCKSVSKDNFQTLISEKKKMIYAGFKPYTQKI